MGKKGKSENTYKKHRGKKPSKRTLDKFMPKPKIKKTRQTTEQRRRKGYANVITLYRNQSYNKFKGSNKELWDMILDDEKRIRKSELNKLKDESNNFIDMYLNLSENAFPKYKILEVSTKVPRFDNYFTWDLYSTPNYEKIDSNRREKIVPLEILISIYNR